MEERYERRIRELKQSIAQHEKDGETKMKQEMQIKVDELKVRLEQEKVKQEKKKKGAVRTAGRVQTKKKSPTLTSRYRQQPSQPALPPHTQGMYTCTSARQGQYPVPTHTTVNALSILSTHVHTLVSM